MTNNNVISLEDRKREKLAEAAIKLTEEAFLEYLYERVQPQAWQRAMFNRIILEKANR